MAHPVIGIDIGTSGVKMATLDASLRGLEFRSAEGFELHQEAAPALDETVPNGLSSEQPGSEASLSRETHIAQTVARKLTERGVGSGDLFLGLDGTRVATRKLQFPTGDMRKVEPMIAFELEDQLPRPLEELVYGYTPTLQTRDRTELLVGTVEKTDVSRLLDAFGAVNRSPRALYCEALALFSLLPPDAPNTCAIVEVGHQRTQILLVKDKRPLFARTLRDGGERIDRIIADTLKIDKLQARQLKEQEGRAYVSGQSDTLPPNERPLAQAIENGLRPLVLGLKQTIQPYREQLEGFTIYVTGGQSQLPGLPEYLAEALLTPCMSLPIPASLGALSDPHRFTMAYALAVTGTSPPKQPKIDFRRGEYSFRGDTSGIRSKLPSLGLYVGLIVFLAIASATTRYSVLRGDEKQLDDSLRQVTKAMMNREIGDFKTALAAIKQSINPEKSAIPRYSALDYFAMLSKSIAQDIDINASEIELRSDRIIVRGESANYNAVEKIVDSLKSGNECFKQVKLDRSRKTSDGSRIEFNISVELGCGA